MKKNKDDVFGKTLAVSFNFEPFKETLAIKELFKWIKKLKITYNDTFEITEYGNLSYGFDYEIFNPLELLIFFNFYSIHPIISVNFENEAKKYHLTTIDYLIKHTDKEVQLSKIFHYTDTDYYYNTYEDALIDAFKECFKLLEELLKEKTFIKNK